MPLRAPKGYIDETDPKVCQIGHPAPPWMASYADLMTELVCFFVILYALSAALNKNVQNAAAQVKEMMDKGQMKGEVKMDREGLKISLEEQGQAAFFTPGHSEATAEIDNLLGQLAPALRKLSEDHDIIIEGHTDNQPISNEFYDSNWELSTMRAASVTRLLIEKYGFPPSRLGAIGYGEFRPIVPNDSPANRSKNRRVVFFVKNQAIEAKKTGPPAAGAPAEAAPAAAPEGAPK